MSDPFLFEPYQKKIVSINRKPAKRLGRKAMGLKPFSHGHDRQAPENELPRFQTLYKRKKSGCSEKGNSHGIQKSTFAIKKQNIRKCIIKHPALYICTPHAGLRKGYSEYTPQFKYIY
jgi:hypothetical protein